MLTPSSTSATVTISLLNFAIVPRIRWKPVVHTNIRRRSGMSWRQSTWSPDVNACLTQLQSSLYSKCLSLLFSLCAVSCHFNGNINVCCQGYFDIISQTGCFHIFTQFRTRHDWSCDAVVTVGLICDENEKTNNTSQQTISYSTIVSVYIWTMKDISCTIVRAYIQKMKFKIQKYENNWER